jgi:hypothetical protein
MIGDERLRSRRQCGGGLAEAYDGLRSFNMHTAGRASASGTFLRQSAPPLLGSYPFLARTRFFGS